MKAYIAGGWFTENQETSVSAIEEELTAYDVDFFSPRKSVIWSPGMDPKDILDDNINAILGSSVLIASTVDKDMGTLFECGYAYCKGIPIAYYFPHSNLKFNVMLGGSAIAVLSTREELSQFAKGLSKGMLSKSDWKGDME